MSSKILLKENAFHAIYHHISSCEQIIVTTTLESIQIIENFSVYHKMYCKSKYVIYLLECRKVRNSFSHNIEQSHRGYQKSPLSQSMQILISGIMSSISMENLH